MISRGERRRTKWKGRVVVAVAHFSPDGPRGGKIEFYFEDEGPRPFCQRMSFRTWAGYVYA